MAPPRGHGGSGTERVSVKKQRLLYTTQRRWQLSAHEVAMRSKKMLTVQHICTRCRRREEKSESMQGAKGCVTFVTRSVPRAIVRLWSAALATHPHARLLRHSNARLAAHPPQEAPPGALPAARSEQEGCRRACPALPAGRGFLWCHAPASATRIPTE